MVTPVRRGTLWKTRKETDSGGKGGTHNLNSAICELCNLGQAM
jgi:hypothetical protein